MIEYSIASGVVPDLLGRGSEAREHFAKGVAAAPPPQAKANAQRQMAMSYAFENDCNNAARVQQEVFDYYVAQKDFYMQGEMANEVARVCIEAGNFVGAEKWYKLGYETGLKEPDIKPDRVALWNFRWEHAQARLAARRGKKDEAAKHVQAAKAILDSNAEMAQAQKIFYPYLTGYVAFYGGDYKTALAELEQANQNDAFIQVLIAQTYEKLGQQDKAQEYYRKAAEVTGHNPPAAFARPFARRKLAAQ
jgi:tetratricopeptide (TPR) repeat protein